MSAVYLCNLVLTYCLIALLCASLMAVYVDNNCKDRAQEAFLTPFLYQWVDNVLTKANLI